ncbi:hypothetical protein L6R52_24375 [Myxococcota bacterium]|nr:hypothetical protein [Myxococcota bacterium]
MSLYALLAEADDAVRTFEGPHRPASAAPEREAPVDAPGSLEELVLARLRGYAARLQGHGARDMYALIMPQLERPLVRVALELARGRQRQAAAMLGIHRNTLRVRLKALGLEAGPEHLPPDA